MTFTSEFKITGVDDDQEIERLQAQLRTLILATETTIPGSRGFGLPKNFVDEDPENAPNVFLIELDEKLEEYLPEYTVSEIEQETGMDGTANYTIHIEKREEEEEDVDSED